ncbi:MAG: CBS domain-containing protein [Pseudomonadota bacterium]
MIIADRPEFQQKARALTFEETVPVMEAVKVMASRNFGAIAITNSAGKLTGIFSERDLMRRVVAEGKDPTSTPLSEVMTSEVRVAKSTDNLIDWLRLMSNERFRHLPVVDDGSDDIVMMSQGDFVSYTWPQLISRVTEQTRASLGERFYPVFIGSALIVFAFFVILFAR